MTSQADQRARRKSQLPFRREILGALPTMRDADRTVQAAADLREQREFFF